MSDIEVGDGACMSGSESEIGSHLANLQKFKKFYKTETQV